MDEENNGRMRRPSVPAARAPRASTSGTFPRPALDRPPPRPVTLGFVLPASLVIPALDGITCERIERADAVPAQPRPRNALVLHADAEPALLEVVLQRASERSMLATLVAAPVFVLGTLAPAHARLAAGSGLFVQEDVTGPRELLRTARRAAVFAQAHAEQDPRTQLEWARGTLGDWIGARHPSLGRAARVVLALAAQGILEPTRIAELLDRGNDVVYHHVAAIREVTGHRKLEIAAGRFQRMLAPLSIPHTFVALPLPSALPRTTPVGGVRVGSDPDAE